MINYDSSYIFSHHVMFFFLMIDIPSSLIFKESVSVQIPEKYVCTLDVRHLWKTLRYRSYLKSWWWFICSSVTWFLWGVFFFFLTLTGLNSGLSILILITQFIYIKYKLEIQIDKTFIINLTKNMKCLHAKQFLLTLDQSRILHKANKRSF